MNVRSFSSYSPVAQYRYRVVVVVSTGSVLHSGGSARIKKGRPINVMARPLKANIRVRVLLHILDLSHVVLTSGATLLSIDTAKITFHSSLVGTISIEVVTSPKITITHVLQCHRTTESIPKFQIIR